LTLGHPRLVNAADIAPQALEAAAALGAHSRHPLSQAVALYDEGNGPAFEELAEKPGLGIEGRAMGSLWRLGRAGWAAGDGAGEGTVLSRDGEVLARFAFEDAIRADAKETIAEIEDRLGPVEMLSGDTESACRRVADRLSIAHVEANLMPAGKVARIEALAAEGRKVLMVGDGLNDAPALGAAHVSMAPATAADIGRNAADFVFLRESLSAVPVALDISRRAGRLVRQNVALAIVYNLFAVPVAILGYVTPLIAAVAMSTSSIIVIANALRLGSKRG
jgi:Cu2+-exporting ATPase